MTPMIPKPTPASVRTFGRSAIVRALFLGALLSTTPSAHAWLFGPGWPEITPEEMALTEPKIDPEAGAEILYREVLIDDSSDTGTSYQYFRRVKVFDARGVEAMKQIELESYGSQRVSRVQARIIRPDGSIEELERDAIHRREVLRLGRFVARRASFALPGLAPGCIVDYKWTVKSPGSAYGYRLFTRMNFPTHKLHFRMKFYPRLNGNWTWQDLPRDAFVRGKGGWHELTLENLPSVVDEPFSPPAAAMQPWLLIHYSPAGRREQNEDSYWREQAQWLLQTAAEDFKPKHRDIRNKTAELLSGIDDPVDQLRRLYDFCQREIENVLHDASGYSAREIEKMRHTYSAQAVLARGYGTGYYINALFASMAGAAGFDVRLAMCSDRSDNIFNKKMAYSGAMPDTLIAVKVPGEPSWRFFDPGISYLGFGQLDWTNENTPALVGDKRDLLLVATPGAAAEASVVNRRGDLTLTAEGDLTGAVETTYTGHLATMTKRRYDSMTAAEQLDAFIEEMTDRLGQVEISNFEILNLTDPTEPLVFKFKLRIAGYADRTARRMFFEPVVFERKTKPVFEHDARHTFLYFPFRWQETDQLVIQLPKGWELEEASSPGVTADEAVLGHKVVLRVAPRSHRLFVDRTFHLGAIGLPQQAYPPLKHAFDVINRNDHHLLTLRAGDEDESGATAPDDSSAADVATTSEAL